MECFIDHIVLKDCRGEAPAPPESGPAPILLTDLPGVTFKMLESIAPGGGGSFSQLFDDIKRRALRKFQQDYARKYDAKYIGFCTDEEGCDKYEIACDNIQLFEQAWLYCVGIELMIERLYSERLNRYTTIDLDKAEALKDFFQVEYEKTLNQGLCMIPRDTIKNCFQRTSQVSRVENLP